MGLILSSKHLTFLSSNCPTIYMRVLSQTIFSGSCFPLFSSSNSLNQQYDQALVDIIHSVFVRLKNRFHSFTVNLQYKKRWLFVSLVSVQNAFGHHHSSFFLLHFMSKTDSLHYQPSEAYYLDGAMLFQILLQMFGHSPCIILFSLLQNLFTENMPSTVCLHLNASSCRIEPGKVSSIFDRLVTLSTFQQWWTFGSLVRFLVIEFVMGLLNGFFRFQIL